MSEMNFKQSAKIFKYFIFLSLFAGIIVTSCVQREKFDKEFVFDRNLVNTKESELVCKLSEDSILLKEIVYFTILNDTSFVVLDGIGVYLYHISGTFIKQFGKRGQAGGEMIYPTFVYATSDFVYIWCASLMKFLIFDHEANFKSELSGFKRAVRKFVVNSSNEILYAYTTGFLNNSENKVVDVIEVYNIAEKSSKKYGERGPEDEVLFTFRNSSGLYVDTDTDRLIYLHPGNLIIHDLDFNSGTTSRYKIDDKAFHTSKVTSRPREIIENMPKLTDYIHQNSVVKDIYKDHGQFIIIAEIGQYDFDEQNQPMKDTKKRKIKLYILDPSFIPNSTILYDYISYPNIVIYSGAIYFLTFNFTDDDQIFALNRFSLFEE